MGSTDHGSSPTSRLARSARKSDATHSTDGPFTASSQLAATLVMRPANTSTVRGIPPEGASTATSSRWTAYTSSHVSAGSVLAHVPGASSQERPVG